MATDAYIQSDTNASSIATNASGISTNVSSIGTLANLYTSETGSLVGAINENYERNLSTDLTATDAYIQSDTNASSIATNASAITANDTDIAANTSSISTNTSSIVNEFSRNSSEYI